MKFPRPIPVTQLAERYNCNVVGDETIMASGINVIHSVEAGDITFVDIPKYFKKSLESEATIILINEPIDVPEGKVLLVCDDPFRVYDDIVASHRNLPLEGDRKESIKIHPTAKVDPQVVIGDHVIIGAHSVIQGHTYIDRYTTIGEHVIIEPGCMIGTDAFYFKKEEGQYIKWTSGGSTRISDHVEIGAGSTINKGVSSETYIGEGTKIDCQVHIGHGCKVGSNCLFAAQVGIGGKTKIGNNVVLYGQVGIAQNLEIGDDVVILAKSGVAKNLARGKTYFGYPATEAFQKNRELASLRMLPDIIRKM